MNENQLFLYAVGIIGTGPEASPDQEEPEAEATQPQRQGHGRRRLPKPLERDAWSMISENTNGSVPSARES